MMSPNFRTTDRSNFDARIAARVAAYGRQLLAADASGCADEEAAASILDLALGRQVLARATDPGRQERIIGYLLKVYGLSRVAAPVLTSVPFTLTVGGSGGGSVYWSAILNKPALITPAQLATALANVGTTRAITVSLAGGKTWGTIRTGDFIAAGTKYQDLFERALVETILPVYTPAALVLTQSAAVAGEVGEAVTNTLTATFAIGDAGALTGLRIAAAGAVLAPGNGTASPLARTHATARTLAGTSYGATVDYAAGAPKPVAPAGTPDTRPAQQRQTDAPQAAESGLPSNGLTLIGYRALFFGAGVAPTGRASALALGGFQLTSDGPSGTVNVGANGLDFCILLPPGKTLTSVRHRELSNATITSAYVAQPTVAITDAGGTSIAGYTPYLLHVTAPYGANNHHDFTYA